MAAKTWHIQEICCVGIFVSVLCICAWLCVPWSVPVTLQTFGIFVTVGFLGKKRGTVAILLYLLLGVVGLPVFAGFQGGPGSLFGPTGGYLIGFIFTGYLSGSVLQRYGEKTWVMVAAFALGLFACYLFGTLWYVWGYTGQSSPASFFWALSQCVIPFCIPDGLKMVLAIWALKRVKPIYVKMWGKLGEN